jgi:hypothetical protein
MAVSWGELGLYLWVAFSLGFLAGAWWVRKDNG